MVTSDPCVGHACDGCSWCLGELNGGVPICCSQVREASKAALLSQISDLDALRQAITDDRIAQVSFTERLLAEVERTLIRRLSPGSRSREQADRVPPALDTERDPRALLGVTTTNDVQPQPIKERKYNRGCSTTKH
jgi:hypothetical protein